jgi:hypothetical protein
MKKRSFGALALLAALGSPGACTTSIDAVGTGGGDIGSVGFASTTIGTTGFAGATVTTGPYPDSPCGSYYDWASCEVPALAHAEMPIEDASQMLAGTWRRCSEETNGYFPIGVRFIADGTVYRLFRAPNPGTGTENLVHCIDDDAHHGVWSLEENTGGGSGGMQLEIEWDDGTTLSSALVIYDGAPAFGLLHSEIDDDQTERFEPEANAIPGS